MDFFKKAGGVGFNHDIEEMNISGYYSPEKRRKLKKAVRKAARAALKKQVRQLDY